MVHTWYLPFSFLGIVSRSCSKHWKQVKHTSNHMYLILLSKVLLYNTREPKTKKDRNTWRSLSWGSFLVLALKKNKKKHTPHPGSPLRYDSCLYVPGSPWDTTRIIIGKEEGLQSFLACGPIRGLFLILVSVLGHCVPPSRGEKKPLCPTRGRGQGVVWHPCTANLTPKFGMGGSFNANNYI